MPSTLPTSCWAATAAQGFISPDLSSNGIIKSGYIVELADSTIGTPDDVVNDCNGTMSRSGYYATALPATVGQTGTRGFSTSSAGTIFFLADGTAPPETGGTPIQ